MFVELELKYTHEYMALEAFIIRESRLTGWVLAQGGKPPLGLKLDTKQVLEAADKKGLQLHTK